MMHRAWSSIVEVPYCLSRSYVKFQGHTALKSVEFDPNWAFPDCNSSLNSPMAMKCCTKLETAKERCHIVFQGHPSNFKVTGDKTTDYDPNWAFPDYRPVAAFKSLRFALFKSIWKIPTASGHSRRPFTSCRTRPSWQLILTGPVRVEWLWVNDFSHNEYCIWQTWPSICWHVGNKFPKYEVPVFIAQTRNHWRKWKGCASVPKNGLPNRCD